MEAQFRDGEIVFTGTLGGGDSLALHVAMADDDRARVGNHGGGEHFGIHLPDRSPAPIDRAVDLVKNAGARIHHAASVPYDYVADVDGYAIDI